MGKLRSLFTEGAIARLLNEEDDSISHESGVSGDSIDAQIDRYFGEYESDSKKVEGADIEQMESVDWRDLLRGTLITEAGEDADAMDDSDDPDAQAPGAEAMTDDEPDKLKLDTIDVEKFANDIVRLVENYDSLLEVRSTILRRASNFLKKTYDDDVIEAFENVLRDDHGMEAGTDKGAIDADKFPAPAADRASGSAAPGMGAAPAV